jgi:fucose 4-O-acetylase-like acetyltransferase
VEDVSEKNDRILWVDFARVIGIWLVILGHMMIPKYFEQFIFAFHMPLFFFISGYLEKSNNGIKGIITNGIRTLLIPYVILYTMFFICNIVGLFFGVQKYNNEPLTDIIAKPIIGMVFGIGRSTGYSTMINVPLWFLLGLFCTKILHGIIIVVSKRCIAYYVAAIGVCIVIMFGLKFLNLPLPFSMTCAVLAFPYFAIGNIIRQYELIKSIDRNSQARVLMAIVIAVIGYVIIIIGVKYNGKADINNFIYGRDALLFYMLGFIGISSTICLSLLYRRKNKLITTVSNGTIIILASHNLLNGYMLKLTNIIGIEQTLTITIIVSIINILVTVIPIKIIQKHIPVIIGGRK